MQTQESIANNTNLVTVAPPLVCAWCHPGQSQPGQSHGICPYHAEMLLAQLRQIQAARRARRVQ